MEEFCHCDEGTIGIRELLLPLFLSLASSHFDWLGDPVPGATGRLKVSELLLHIEIDFRCSSTLNRINWLWFIY